MPPAEPVIAVVGPTGTGKSDLAVDLALALGGEVVNADALQVYRGMDIGTAKLPVAERRDVPHHLLDVLDVTEEASVATYQRQARDAIDAVIGRGRRPVLVGGSGLYVRAALDHLDLPGTDPVVRARLEAEAETAGLGPLRARLTAVDPVAAGRVHDARRLIRALEVHELTGRPFSSFMPDRRYVRPTVQLGLRLPTPALRDRLAARVHAMVEAGLAAEVARLDAAGLRRGRTASRAIGYAQFLAVADGAMSEADAIADTVTATQRFAKRQRTWFGADPRIHWLDVDRLAGPALLDAALAHLA
ncbi:tRNA dimethylallyltransferase [Tersicoccus solisilvae]|uniref:tRNA dimethylallyltransferase n=1 Tax=Tersicoccus solisilvae TaxID=1882339 RepID=A0ABQ1PE92_9MICC|nr:tRNA (adenosine(37)-N6)-dimethylallyltransferase MiaA [Tersicoccus solisilvae]GGC95425.1 tRNA dimethylallyltransferase [Tersicoccus solisilvae]